MLHNPLVSVKPFITVFRLLFLRSVSFGNSNEQVVTNPKGDPCRPIAKSLKEERLHIEKAARKNPVAAFSMSP